MKTAAGPGGIDTEVDKAMGNPNYYFQNAIDFLKGWPSPSAVDKTAALSSNVTGKALSGRCVHLNSSGQFELGAVGTQMPIFLIPASTDYDVSNPAPVGSLYTWTALLPAGVLGGLVAVGSYELETTEYDTGSTFHCNDPLHSPVEAEITGADKSQAGMLYNAKKWTGGSSAAIAAYTNNICGIVSGGNIHSDTPTTGVRVNQLKANVLPFWPYFLPGSSSSV